MFRIVQVHRLKKILLWAFGAMTLWGNGITAAQGQSLLDQAKVQYYLSGIEDEQFTYQQKIAFYDSILSYYHKADNHSMDRVYAFEKMNLYYDNESYLEAYRIGVGLMKEFNDTPVAALQDSLQKNLTHLIMGKCCRYLGMFDESVSHFYSIIQQPFNRYTIEAYSFLGFAFMQMNQMENSKVYHEKALELLAGADTGLVQKIACVIYNNAAGYYYTIDRLDSAVYYLRLSIDNYDNAENVISKSYIFHNMGVIYQQMGENLMAKDYYDKAIEASPHEPYKLAVYKQNLAFLLMEENKLDEAEKLYSEALEEAEAIGAQKRKGAIYIELSDLYYKRRQFEKAFKYLQEGVTIRDSIFNSQHLEKISLLSQQLDNYKFTMEKDLLEKELQVANLSNEKKTIVVGILVFLLIIISIAAFIIIRHLMRMSMLNIEKETKANQEVIRKEFETTIEEKNRKLASNALFLIRTDEMISNLAKSIKQQLASNDLMKMRSLSKEMEAAIQAFNTGQGWDEFVHYFEEIHSSFYINLNKACPDLSKMEQRLCALLILNMSLKEIAQITNRSVRTIETLVYRLRKNLNVPSDEKTVHFLRKFMDETEPANDAEGQEK